MKFKEAVKKLDEIAGQRYHRLTYEYTTYHSGKVECLCEVYLDGFDMHKSDTWGEAIALLEKEMEEVTTPEVEVSEEAPA